ncbi:hypothetical protein HELRODRAFT_189632 [Helobdella robusta]|uniref:PH domain-containing protein n=1 Tax=Helobdella robusta TaxID=6412 RepID=T1FR79_HELRO|nr:hypothetical protein HELRODRAFT_189632 [Helobdella robusta]ESN92953.1 hypothetical protein HELRODRAFT_189632 [Helobdella robusta]
MEPILKGWLTKSPPEKKKSSGHWNLFGAKWKRRFFVLYAPPMALGIVESRGAMLEYYSSKKLNTKVGIINLEDCDEVLSNLDSDTYKNVFSLHTKHKGKERTYYLVADTEEEMNNWVDQLCRVLGLLENDESKLNFSPEGRQYKPYTTTTPKPIPNFQSHPSRIISQGSSVPNSALGSRLNSSEPNLLNQGIFSMGQRPLSNMPQMTNYHNDDCLNLDLSNKKLKATSSFPDIDVLPTEDMSLFLASTIKPREKTELPPIPPDKTRKSLECLNFFRDDNAAMSNLKITDGDTSFMGPPPPKPPKEKKSAIKVDEAGLSLLSKATNLDETDNTKLNFTSGKNYDIPKELSYDSPANMKSFSSIDEDEDEDDEIVYNTPKSFFTDNKQQNQTLQNEQHHPVQQQQQHEQVMKEPPRPASRKSIINRNHKPLNSSSIQTNHNVDSFYEAPKKQASIVTSVNDDFYNVPKPNAGNDFYDVPQKHYTSEQHTKPDTLPYSAEILDAVNSSKETTSCTLSTPSTTSSSACPPVFKPVPARRTKLSPGNPKQEDEASTKVTKQESLKPSIPLKPSTSKKGSSKQAIDQSAQSTAPSSETSPVSTAPSSTTVQSLHSTTQPHTTLKIFAPTQPTNSTSPKKGPTTTLIHESIRFTQRSKSFKRSVTGHDVMPTHLPVKKLDKCSSSSDDIVSDED